MKANDMKFQRVLEPDQSKSPTLAPQTVLLIHMGFQHLLILLDIYSVRMKGIYKT